MKDKHITTTVSTKKDVITTILKLAGTFIATAGVCLLLLMCTSLIPQSAISKGCNTSADYFDSNELFSHIIDGQFNTTQDNYADCILVNIMYNIGQKDGQSLFSSLMEDSYYHEDMTEVNEGLRTSVDTGATANQEYSRYWHGSMIFLRPLFTVTDITGARLVLGVLALILATIGAALLWKKKYCSYAVIYLIGMVLVNSWMLCFCIEYVTTFLVMGAVTIAIILLHNQTSKNVKCISQPVSKSNNANSISRPVSKSNNANSISRPALLVDKHVMQILLLMVISGAVTCFLDFLTTETLALTVPLLTEFIMSLSDHKNDDYPDKDTFLQYIFYILSWGISYAAMFATKWLLSFMTLGKKSLDSTLSQAEERINGTVYLGNTNLDPKADVFQRLSGDITRNMSMFFPFKNSMNTSEGALLFIICALVIFSIVYLFRSKTFQIEPALMILFIGLIPYIRFLLLSNHAYMHYFFTYRAQLVTIMALLYICWEFGLKNVFVHKNV